MDSTMRDLARAYRALLKAAIITAFEYRAQLILWVVSAVFPLVMMVVWLAVVAEVGPAAGYDRVAFISYYVATALVYRLTFSWIAFDWDRQIREGDLSVKLLKPVDPFHQLLSNQLGWRIIDVVIFLPFIALAALLVPAVQFPLDVGRTLAVVAAVLGGFTINVLMSSVFGMIAFWSTQSRNVFGLVYGIGNFLSGFIAPLALFPTGIRNIAQLLPFRSTIGLPVEIMIGKLDWPGIWFGLAVTGAWCVGFWILFRILWRRGLRRYEAVGA